MDWDRGTQYVAIDTETFGIDRSDEPYAVSLCNEHGQTVLIEWAIDPIERKIVRDRKFHNDIKQIKELCRRKQLVFHNIGFDIQKLELIGCHLRWRHNSHDTSVLPHIIDSEVHSNLQGRLKSLALQYLDFDDDDESALRKATTQARKVASKLLPDWELAERKSGSDHLKQDYWVPKQLAQHLKLALNHPWNVSLPRYAVSDAERTMLLFLFFQGVIGKWEDDDQRHEIVERENRLMYCIYDMQQIGMHISRSRTKFEIKRYGQKQITGINLMRDAVSDQYFNPNSPIQLSKTLFRDLRFPTALTKPTKGWSKEKPQYVTDSKVRESLNEWAELHPNRKRDKFLLGWDAYKECNASINYLNEYLGKADANGVLRCSLLQNGTATTRMSSRNPNGQNIKKADEEKGIEGLRNVFGPVGGRRWYCFDYSQLQLRIFAYLAQEQSMLDAFEAGWDFHSFIASKIFSKDIDKVTSSERRTGKNVNFGFIFGASPAKIERTAGISGLWNTVCTMFPSAHEYMSTIKSQVRRSGYITTPHGYRLYVDQPHKGVNYQVQGCEGDIVKQGMLNCEEILSEYQNNGFNGQMIFQVHDELIFDFPTAGNDGYSTGYSLIKPLVEAMEQPGLDIGMVTPVGVEYTDSDWAHTQKFERGIND